MPTDFLANWLTFLGKSAFKWSNLSEPSKEEDQRFYRLWLGVACFVTATALVYGFTSVFPSALISVVALFTPPTFTNGALTGFHYALNFLMWLMLTPILVGAVYRFRHIAGIWSLGLLFLIWVMVGVTAYCGTGDKVAILTALLLTPPLACPPLPHG